MSFINVQVDTDGLPKASELEFQPLPAAYHREVLIQLVIVFGLIIAGTFSLRFLPIDNEEVLMRLVYLPIVATLVALVIVPLGIRQAAVKAYALRERDIAYRSGLFFRKTVVLAFNRVQHIEVATGPLQRLFGLASLKFFTAGGASVDLKIDGLVQADAEQLREHILGRNAIESDA